MSEETKIYPGSIDTRVAILEQNITSINQTLIRIENKFDIRLDRLDERIDSNFKWTLALVAAPLYTSIIGFIVGKIIHWF